MSKILVVEDEAPIRENIIEILELSGYETLSAEDGKVAYDIILSEKPDVVLCDVNMPNLDGFGLLGAINQKLKDELMPVFLFLTAKVETSEIRHGMNLGADDYILKPFDPSRVLEVIQIRLEKRAKMLELLKSGQKVEEVSNHSMNKLAIPDEEGMRLVEFKDIVQLNAERAYCTFVLSNGDKVLVSKPMKEFEETLLKQGFFKAHKSTIVNLDYAEKYVRGKGGNLVLKDGSIVVVSTRRKEELMNLLRSRP